MGSLIGYARVLTAEQSVDLQTDELRAAGCVKGLTEQVCGAVDRRPELDRALEQLRAGDTLVVWRLDRLGRSLRHLIDTVTGLDAQGVGFRSLRESIDTTTSGGRLVFHLFGALAQFEREVIRDRTVSRAGVGAGPGPGRGTATEADRRPGADSAAALWGACADGGCDRRCAGGQSHLDLPGVAP